MALRIFMPCVMFLIVVAAEIEPTTSRTPSSDRFLNCCARVNERDVAQGRHARRREVGACQA
jgi:hypothetical protein